MKVDAGVRIELTSAAYEATKEPLLYPARIGGPTAQSRRRLHAFGVGPVAAHP